MARVIKADPQHKAESPKPQRRAGNRQVIQKEVYRAQQDAQELTGEYEKKRQHLLAEGRQRAAQALEEAQAEGAEEAFAQAASEALVAFRSRADRYAEAGDDIRVLALEVVRKIFGAASKLDEAKIRAVLDDGLHKLRARRTLRVQVPSSRLVALANERPHLIRALRNEPDLVLEAVNDVSPGFARVVTEVGGALCSEQSALDHLAESIDVAETAVAPEPVARKDLASFDSYDDEETEQGAVRSRDARVGANEVRVSKGIQPLGSSPDPEATQSLDVSKLRAEIDLSDEDDLYTDESVLD